MGVEKLKKYTNRISTVIFATVLIMFAVLMASSFSTDQASAQTAPSTNTQTDATTEVSSEGTTCAVERIGWIVCPVIEGAAKMSDYLFGFLAKYFLEIDAELLTSSPKGGGGTVTAWEQARNLANIMFVIAFILIIYSQITGSGLNNYGIKRMLPRLIVAAIAVNLSYYICQVMVDLSNLLGYNIMSALQQISNQIGPSVMGADAQGTDTQTGGGTLAQIATYALAAAGIVWVLIAFMGGTIGLVLVTCIVIVAVLLLRKAFIVLLVVVSPIAFVFYLLPNTEKYFSKWLSMFWKLLLVFPIVALLLGAGQLASTIILVSDAQRNGTPNQCGAPPATDAPQQAGEGGVKSSSYGVEGECALTIENNGKSQQAGITLSLVATGVAVAPLLAVWAVLQGALAAAGAIGGKISGAIQKGASSGVNGAGSWASKNTAIGRGLAARKAIKQNYKDQKFAKNMNGTGIRGRYTRTMARGFGGNVGLMTDNAIGKRIPGTQGLRQQSTRLESSFRGAQEKIDQEAVKNELTAIEYAPEGKLAGAEIAFRQAIANKDATKAKAAVAALMTTGEKGIEKLSQQLETVQQQANASGNFSLANDMKEYMMQAHGNVKEKNAAIAKWSTSGQGATGTVANYAADSATYSALSDAQFASQTEHSLNSAGAKAALQVESINADGKKETRGHRLLSNPENAKNFSDEKRTIIATHGGSTQPY